MKIYFKKKGDTSNSVSLCTNNLVTAQAVAEPVTVDPAVVKRLDSGSLLLVPTDMGFFVQGDLFNKVAPILATKYRKLLLWLSPDALANALADFPWKDGVVSGYWMHRVMCAADFMTKSVKNYRFSALVDIVSNLNFRDGSGRILNDSSFKSSCKKHSLGDADDVFSRLSAYLKRLDKAYVDQQPVMDMLSREINPLSKTYTGITNYDYNVPVTNLQFLAGQSQTDKMIYFVFMDSANVKLADDVPYMLEEVKSMQDSAPLGIKLDTKNKFQAALAEFVKTDEILSNSAFTPGAGSTAPTSPSSSNSNALPEQSTKPKSWLEFYKLKVADSLIQVVE